MPSIHHYWSWLVPKIRKMTEGICTLTTSSSMYQAWGDAELTVNLLCSVHNPNILEQAALARSDGPHFLSYFYFTNCLFNSSSNRGGKKWGFFYITVFNVSLIFTAVLVAAARNCSACHVLLSQDKGSSTLLLGSETSSDKGSWGSGLPPLVFCINPAKCFSTCTSELRNSSCFVVLGNPNRAITWCYRDVMLRAWRGSLLNSPGCCGFVSAGQGALGLVDLMVHPHHQVPAPEVPPLCQHPHSLILALLVTCYHTSAISVLNTASHSKSWEISLRDFPVASRNSRALWLLIKQLGGGNGINNIKQHSHSLGSYEILKPLCSCSNQPAWLCPAALGCLLLCWDCVARFW